MEPSLGRRGVDAAVEAGSHPGTLRIRYRQHATPRVSIVIPTRDRVKYFTCLHRRAAEARTAYRNYEIVMLDNDSAEEATRAYLACCGHRAVAAPGPSTSRAS